MSVISLLWMFGNDPHVKDTCTWTAAEDSDYRNVNNWAEGQYAMPDDLIVIASETIPTGTLPTTGVMSFSVYGAYVVTLNDWLNGCSIGHVIINHAGAVVTAGATIAGSLNILAGQAFVGNGHDIIGGVDVGANATLTLSGEVDFSNVATVWNTGTLVVANGATLTTTSSIVMNGGSTVNNSGIIQGSVYGDSTSSVATWLGTGNIVCHLAGYLDLGTNVPNSQSVEIAAGAGGVTLLDNFTCAGLTLTSGNLIANGKTITIGTGGLSKTGGTLNVAGSLHIVASQDCNVAWDDDAYLLGTFVANGDVTFTDDVVCQKVGAGTGTLALGDYDLDVYPTTNNFWLHAGTATSTDATTGRVQFFSEGISGISNASAVDVGEAYLLVNGKGGTTVTFSSNVTCGILTGYGTNPYSLVCTIKVDGSLDSLGWWPGSSAGAAYLCGLTLSATGRHTIGNQGVARIGSGTGHVWTLGGTISFGADVVMAGITPNFGTSYLDAPLGSVINGASSGTVLNGNAVISRATVTNIIAPVTNPIYVYDPGERTNEANNGLFPVSPSDDLAGFIGAGNANVFYARISGIGPAPGSRGRLRSRPTTHTDHGRLALNR